MVLQKSFNILNNMDASINTIKKATAFQHRNLPRLLLQAREAVMAHTRPSLREHALSDQQWRVLRVLGENGTVETGHVAREAFILGPSLTGVLTRMERDGLITRARDPVDQRRTVVQATERGHALVATLSTTIETHYQWMSRPWAKTNWHSCMRCWTP